MKIIVRDNETIDQALARAFRYNDPPNRELDAYYEHDEYRKEQLRRARRHSRRLEWE